MPENHRLTQLKAMLQRDPNDTFLLYAMAMEHRKAQNFLQAVEYLKQVLVSDPACCAAYFQLGQVWEQMKDFAAAKEAYRQGSQAAAQKGDLHARDEMRAALDAIERFQSTH